MEDVIIDTNNLHIRHIEPVIELPYHCPYCKKEVEPIFVDGMAQIILGGILSNELPSLPRQNEKVRIIIQREGKI